MNDIRCELKEVSDMGIMTVYHGGYQPVEHPEIRTGKNTKDFGTGFYCTIIKEQAQRWAKRYSTKIVSIYEVRLHDDLNIKEFKEMTEEWLDFIIACRSGQQHDYDIVIGAMADDQIYNFVTDYMDGVITREQFDSNIQHIRLYFVQMRHWNVCNIVVMRRYCNGR